MSATLTLVDDEIDANAILEAVKLALVKVTKLEFRVTRTKSKVSVLGSGPTAWQAIGAAIMTHGKDMDDAEVLALFLAGAMSVDADEAINVVSQFMDDEDDDGDDEDDDTMERDG